MKVHNGLTDDDGVKWEFLYEQDTRYEQDEETGKFEYAGTVVREFRYRLDGASTGWLALPPWADVEEEWKINLCLFDEDDESGELTFWKVAS